jgi:TPR repeat protein
MQLHGIHFFSLVAIAAQIALTPSCFADRIDINKEGALVQQFMEQGKPEEALAHARVLLSMLDQYSRESADAYSALVAELYLNTNRPDEAEPLYRRAIIALRKRNDAAPRLAMSLHDLSFILMERQAYDEAEAFAREAKSILAAENPPRFERIALNLNMLGRISDFREKHQEAQKFFLDELSVVEKNMPGSPQYRETLFNLSESFRMQGDWAESTKWCAEAAEAGLPAAQYYMGIRLFMGRGIKKDYAKSASWFQKAADAGLPGALNNLGLMYSQGLGVSQDDTEAVRLYKKSAKLGYVPAQINLARKLAAGEGTPVDLVQAYYLLSLVAQADADPDDVKDAIQLKSEIAAKMTREQIGSAVKLLQTAH